MLCNPPGEPKIMSRDEKVKSEGEKAQRMNAQVEMSSSPATEDKNGLIGIRSKWT